MKILSILLIFYVAYNCQAISDRDLYNINAPGSTSLQNGNDESRLIQLRSPVHFYSESHDSIYINTNGILTFINEFPEFLNIPFPIEYPAISPFYSNIDTSSSGSITFYETADDYSLNRAASVIRSAFTDASDFRAKSLFVATWNRVGKWKGEEPQDRRSTEANTFQVAITSNDEESYVEFLYPQNGIQWVQGESGESGLPDIRARAGFVANDERHTLLKGSGTDRVRNLPETSNYGQNGRWLYRVGKLSDGENIEEPDNSRSFDPLQEATSCSNGGRLQCHSSASCEDVRGGFSCKCRDSFYGNGFSCIKNDIPLRVTGAISGHIGESSVALSLQAYVVMVDGRAYTAITGITGELGPKVQLLEIIGGVIGWLFAKPIGDTINGYQATGGKFNHTSTIRFSGGENLYIVQRYVGLNLWDQLAAEIELSGDVPNLHEGIKVTMDDFIEEYKASSPGEISAVSNHKIQLSSGDPDIEYTIYQSINYEASPSADVSRINGNLKTSKIQIGFYSQENAVRISTVSKVGITSGSNPCMEGTANCGENTVCVPTGDDTYDCQCKNGYTFAAASPDRDAPEVCVDIDECRGSHICSEHARCVNRNGGYDCHCMPGYEGNGYDCERISEHHQHPHPTEPTVTQCRHCSENAHCAEGVCICNAGFMGNGQNCRSICARDEMFDGENCVPFGEGPTGGDEIVPYCTSVACVCPRGYKLIEYAFKTICRVEEPTEDPTEVSCDILNNCHPFANCEFDEHLEKYQCVCASGYDGNGIDCIELEANCVHEDICDVNAACIYNTTLRRNFCVCQTGYEGNGRTCNLAAECQSTADCGYRSVCAQGVCECDVGYERDNSDLCVPIGSCNGAYCAENAFCRFDNRMKVNYCLCPEGFIGDGVIECKSVPPPCNVRNNCGLHASCVPNYRTASYECLCNDGFNGDGFVCVPERNCNNIPGMCDANAHCALNHNKFVCICNQGFIGDGLHCNEPPKLESGFLIVSQGVAAVKVPLTGNRRGTPVSTASMAIGIDKDCAEGRVYWSDITAKAILSAKYDGTDRKTFISEDIISPEGVAVDWISRRLYWTDSTKDTIEVASLDNATLRTVIINRNLVNPRGIAVDPLQSKLYWSDWNRQEPKIESSNLDGTERELMLGSPAVTLPNSLALSLSTGEICYADAGNKKIECLDTYGRREPRLIAGNLSYPFGLAITDEHYYWSDWTTKKIESVDLHSERQPSIMTPLFSSHKMYGMTAVTDRCPLDFSACLINNGDCPPDYLCIVNRLSPSGKSCKCITHGACNIAHHDD